MGSTDRLATQDNIRLANDFWSYRKKSRDIFSSNLLENQIEKYRIILETIESNEKREIII
ncbi:unnamed protein product [marine sediment metagenome]|uniref:Uncharacterized protein n=1 Tax=marine sediment metagenome TaxID=412755 RepID=X0TCW0_9ZZZZ